MKRRTLRSPRRSAFCGSAAFFSKNSPFPGAQAKRTAMKRNLPLLCLTALLLAACSTSTTTSEVTYDAQGREVSSRTTSQSTNDTADKARELGRDVKDGVVSGYEWTRDKTIEGYEWVKEKSVKAYDSMKKK